MCDQLPSSDVSLVLAAQELGYAEGSLLISDGCLGTRSSQRTPRGDKLSEPLRVVGMYLVVQVPLKLKARCLQLPQRCQGRRGESCIAIDVRAAWPFESQCAESRFVVRPKGNPLRQRPWTNSLRQASKIFDSNRLISGAGRGNRTPMTLRSADFESAFSTVAGACKSARFDRITPYATATCEVTASRTTLQVEALDTGAKYHQKYPRKFAEKV